MFIETLEFTIPIDLCDLFSTLKRGPRSNLEFPASVNSYGTTQDANIQVALRSNKLTFKVDGVSSNSSMISKSECKTLKLSVFDVDCSLSGAEYEQVTHMVSQPIYSNTHVAPAKRSRDRPSPMKSPPSKTNRSSFQETKHQNIPQPSHDPLQSKSMSETVCVKLEPDLIEIEPDSEHYGDESNQSIDHRHNTQAALDRLSHPQSSHSQSSASSSSSFHQNVPHVPDYAEPSTSQGNQHGDQNMEDYVVYQQEDDDYGEDNDNSADFGNDAPYMCKDCGKGYHLKTSYYQHVKRYHIDPALFCNHCGKKFYSRYDLNRHEVIHTGVKAFTCDFCQAKFFTVSTLKIHVKRVHGTPFEYYCKFCGKGYHDKEGLWFHERGHYDTDMKSEEGSSDIQEFS